MGRALLWLVLTDLRQGWLRPAAAAVALALSTAAVAFFARQMTLRQQEILAGYEQAGAASFVARISNVADDEVDALANAVRSLGAVSAVEAPYSGVALGFAADTTFVVFQNDQQQEYLGARTSVLGVGAGFDLIRDYYVDFHDVNPTAPHTVLGIPLLAVAGSSGPPAADQVLVPSGMAEYVGIGPGAQAEVELRYGGTEPPVTRKLVALKLAGTFDAVGPDEARFDPFWQLKARGKDVLTVRRSESVAQLATTLPIVLNAQVLRNFLNDVRSELTSRGDAQRPLPSRSDLIVRAHTLSDVPVAEQGAAALLRSRGLEQDCGAPHGRSFCIQVPQRNNFETALREGSKVESGSKFFAVLLLILLGVGSGAMQLQSVFTRWREYGVLNAVGFSPRQIIACDGLRLLLVVTAGGLLTGATALLFRSALSGPLVLIAWGLAAAAAGFGAFAALLWPLSLPPADFMRKSQ